MSLIHEEAIVLRRLDYSESSQVLALLTREHGKIRAIAKGSRRSTKKRFEPGIDLLEVGAVVLSVRSPGQTALATLTEWKQARTFSGLRQALPRWQAAHYAADIVAELTEDWDPQETLYRSLLDTLAVLSETTNILGPLVQLQRITLHEAGVLPRLDVCVACGRVPSAGDDVYFSSFEGGLICRDCEPARVEKRLVRMFPTSVLLGDATTDAETAASFDLLHYHLTHQMGRPPASSESLLQQVRVLLTGRR